MNAYKSIDETPAPSRPISVDRLRDELRRDYMERGLTRDSFVRLDHVCRRLVQIGVRSTADLAEMDDADAGRFAEGQPDADNLRRTLRVVYRQGYKLGLLLSPPKFSGIPRRPDVEPAAPPSMGDIEGWLRHQCRAAADSWQDFRGYAATATAAFAGLNIGEVRDLLVKDLDFEGGKITVRRRLRMKDRPGFRHRVEMPPAFRRILARWEPLVVGDWLFPGNDQRGPWDRARAHDWLSESARAAGYPALAREPFRALRRFFIAHVEDIWRLKADVPTGFRWDARRRGTGKSIVPAKLLTGDEVTRYMVEARRNSATWDGHRFFTFEALCLLAGARRGQLVELWHADVHIDRSPPWIAVVDRYHGSLRQTPLELTREAADLLGRWLGRPDHIESPYVFPGPNGGAWDNSGNGPGSLCHQFRTTAVTAGIAARVGPTELRRYWQSCGGRVILGDAWRDGRAPEPITSGPRARGVGRKPSSRRKDVRRRRTVTWANPATWNPDDVCAVQLKGPDDRVFARDVDKGVMGPGQREIIKLLVKYHPRALTLDEIESESAVKYARDVLRRLMRDPDLGPLIVVEKDADGRNLYRIMNL